MGFNIFLLLCCFVSNVIEKHGVVATAEEPDTTYPALYQWGKEAYTKERWYECVAFMKRALEDFDYYQATILHCQKRCRKLLSQDLVPLSDVQMDAKLIAEIRIFENLAQNSMCLRRCVDERLGARPNSANIRGVNGDFDKLQPYSYMQLCYWKLHDLKNAVSSAYTFHLRNDHDSMMKENLQFYSTQPGFSPQFYNNLREKDHENYYRKGIDFYDEENYENAALNFEKCLERFLTLYENCRLICIQTFPLSDNDELRGNFLDLYSAFTGHIKTVLTCRTKCLKRLSNIKGTFIDDLVPLVLNYLQFSYWKTNKLRKTAEAVATFLEFHPNDRTMIDNMNFYLTSALKTDENLFIPRQDLIKFKEQYVLEFKLLAKLDERMTLQNNEFPTEHPDDYKLMDSEIDAKFEKDLQSFFEADWEKDSEKRETDLPKKEESPKLDETPKKKTPSSTALSEVREFNFGL